MLEKCFFSLKNWHSFALENVMFKKRVMGCCQFKVVQIAFYAAAAAFFPCRKRVSVCTSIWLISTVRLTSLSVLLMLVARLFSLHQNCIMSESIRMNTVLRLDINACAAPTRHAPFILTAKYSQFKWTNAAAAAAKFHSSASMNKNTTRNT